MNRSDLFRASLGLGATAAPGGIPKLGATKTLTKVHSGGIYVPHVVAARPHTYTFETLAYLKKSGIVAFDDKTDGYRHFLSGSAPQITPRPACSNPLFKGPLDGNCYEPGGGDDLGYPS